MKNNETKKETFLEKIEKKPFFQNYRNVFSIQELEEKATLQWVLGAFLFSSFLAFYSWINSSAITKTAYETNKYICWPYFQSCGNWYFLESLPYGYSQTTYYMFLFGILLLTVYFVSQKKWIFAHICTVFIWLWKFLVVFVLTTFFSGNYEYYDIILGFILLFLPAKEYYLKLVFVLLYFLAATIKLSDGWIASTYLTSLKTGMPIFSNNIAPLVTNLVIFMQIVGSWFLMSSRPLLQRSALTFFILFHLYSGILVGYRYPATTIPMLLILFGPFYQYTYMSTNRKSLWGLGLIALLFSFQGMATFGSPDRKMTLENNMYGLYMFEANHQCVSSTSVYYQNGETSTSTSVSENARMRCSPYAYWFNLKQQCKRNKNITKIEWELDHSINGGPFYRIVSTPNVCALTYKSFGHNEWIKWSKGGAKMTGYPEKNYYR